MHTKMPVETKQSLLESLELALLLVQNATAYLQVLIRPSYPRFLLLQPSARKESTFTGSADT